ncbi:MAG: hypothetical protein Q7U04_00355, partial [Bacteriovorax sp.]|nr:hypothetical protein [Bacteriovorax sp.]
MFKHIASFCLIILITCAASNTSYASTHKKKKKSGSKTAKNLKQSRKSRRFHHGNGPDLKSITTDSPYKEDPNNGVNPVETKQP